MKNYQPLDLANKNICRKQGDGMTGLKNGQKTLIIRYGKKGNCIEEHNSVIEEDGYCWFGKIGVVPSAKVVQAVLEEDNPIIPIFQMNMKC